METKHPDVFVQERKSTPRISEATTTVPGFLVATKRGKIDKAGYVTSFGSFERQYGSYYRGSTSVHSMKLYFDEGGGRAFIARVIGSGHATSSKTLRNMGSVGTAAEYITPDEITTLDLTKYRYLRIAIDGGSELEIDLWSGGTSPTNARTLADIINAINSVIASIASDDSGYLKLSSLTIGAGSEIKIAVPTSGAFAAVLLGTGLNIAALNAGNHSISLNVDGQASPITIDVTGDAGAGGSYNLAGVITAINNAAVAAWGATFNSIASDNGGQLQIQSPTTGASSSIVLGEVPDGKDARLELFGIPEGTGDVTENGGTGDATQAVLGLPTGSEYVFNGLDIVPDIMKVMASSPGVWGDTLSVSTQAWEADLMEPILSGQESAKLGSLRDAKIGDIIKITDGTTKLIVHINDVDTTTQEVFFYGQGTSHAPIGAGTGRVTSSSRNRKVTNLTKALVSTDTIIEVESSLSMNVGTRLVIDDKTTNNIATPLILGINGNKITLSAPIGKDIANGAVVSTMHFGIVLKEGGEIVDTFTGLSVEPTDKTDFFAKRLYGDSNESIDIEVEELTYSITNFFHSLPEPVVDAILDGGNDGSAPSDLDWIGNDTTGEKTSIHLFDDIEEISIVAAPGMTFSYAQRILMQKCKTKNLWTFFADMPLEDNLPLEAREYILQELRVDHSYGTIIYPWLKIRDPESNNVNAYINIPISGAHVAAAVSTAREKNVSQAPANFRIASAEGLTHYTNDGEQDLLAPLGINVTRSFANEGIVIWGARTLNGNEDGTHYLNVRLLLNFVKSSMLVGNRWAVFQNNDPILWRQMEGVNRAFLKDLWDQSMLYPTNDVTKAFFVKCDSETTDEAARKKGRVYLEAGINPQYPAEFIIVRVGQWDGGESIEEIIKRA